MTDMSAGVWDGTYTDEQRAAAEQHWAQQQAARERDDADSDDEASSMYSRRAPMQDDDHYADDEQAPARQSVAAEPLIQAQAQAPAPAARRPGYFSSFGARRKALGGGISGFFKALFGRGYRTLERQQAAQRAAAESGGNALPDADPHVEMGEAGSPPIGVPERSALQGASSQPSVDMNAMLGEIDLNAIFEKPVQAPVPAPERAAKPAPVPQEAPKEAGFFSRLNFRPARHNARRGSGFAASQNPIEERAARRVSRVAPEYDTERDGGESAAEDAAYAAAQIGERVGLPASAIAYRKFHDRVPRSEAMQRVQKSYDWQFAQFTRNKENTERGRPFEEEARLRNNVSDAKKGWGRGIGDSRLRRLVQLGVQERDGEYHL